MVFFFSLGGRSFLFLFLLLLLLLFFFQDERIIEREEKLDERPGREVDIKGVRRETGNGERERTAVMEWRKTGRRRRKAGQESERKGEKERWKEWKESKEK